MKAGIKGWSGAEYKNGEELELRCASRSVEGDCVRPLRHTGGGGGGQHFGGRGWF